MSLGRRDSRKWKKKIELEAVSPTVTNALSFVYVMAKSRGRTSGWENDGRIISCKIFPWLISMRWSLRLKFDPTSTTGVNATLSASANWRNCTEQALRSEANV